MKNSITKILKESNLSLTERRRKILELFLKSNYALVHAEIENELHGIIDRVTVYRTLQSFLKKGLIHLIPTTDNSIKYALTKQEQHQKNIQAKHVHFVCTNCNKTTCLDHTTMPHVKLPGDYKAEINEMIITGICGECNK
jgi:Fur family transcriptional regulator, ferric uptake regulator